MLRPIRRALFSVSDKTGLVPFAQELHTKYNVELIATGGTKKALADAGLPVKDVSDLTGFPEILDGRVKTLHPAVYAGLLAKRDKPEHMATLVEHNLLEIDLVVCNLYPFEQTVAKPGVTEAEAIENIDIGGPCMIRAAAKNFESVAVLVDPGDYQWVAAQLRQQSGSLGGSFRRVMARMAFERVELYDAAITRYFSGYKHYLSWVPPELAVPDPAHPIAARPLRYGENPHQEGYVFLDSKGMLFGSPHAVAAGQLHGKELSYNNILDIDAALNLAREFTDPTAVVVKHNNPCGAATATTLVEAFRRAWDGDPLSAFGGVLAFNHRIDMDTASAVTEDKKFVECIIAPDYEPSALDALKQWKRNVRLLKTGPLTGPPEGLNYHRVDGGWLVQTRDVGADDLAKWEVKTKRPPTAEEKDALWFAWLVCKHVKSNAIVLANQTHIVGVGAGQMSRVVSVEIAIKKAGDRARGSVLASDAFFPFPDNVELAAAAGITAIVQPGGSVKDADSIAACDKYGIAMMFTGVRHFRH